METRLYLHKRSNRVPCAFLGNPEPEVPIAFLSLEVPLGDNQVQVWERFLQVTHENIGI